MIPLFKVATAPNAYRAVKKVLDSGYVGQGKKTDEFEVALQKEWNLPYPPIAVNSGTSALDLAYHLCGIGRGDVVISTPQTCMATNTPLALRRAHIVWADVDRFTGLISPYSVMKIRDKLGTKVKAIIAVDWAGRLCDYRTLKEIGVPIIQDAAHAHWATGQHGEPIHQVGGDHIIWSFQAIKHLNTVDGGALFCPKVDVERARLLRWFGLDRTQSAMFRCSQRVMEVGFKYQPNDVLCSIGLANIPIGRASVERARENAKYYSDCLDPFIYMEDTRVSLPPYETGCSYWLFTILVKNRDAFIKHMADLGVTCSPVHARNDLMPAFLKHYSSCDGSGLRYFSEQEVCIPVGWWVSNEDRVKIVKGIESWASA